MVTIIRGSELTRISANVKPDSKRRVVLPRSLVKKDSMFHIYCNKLGQIVLDPQVTIPASEAWLFEDKNALASVDKGMAEAASRQVIDRGSFAKYAKR